MGGCPLFSNAPTFSTNAQTANAGAEVQIYSATIYSSHKFTCPGKMIDDDKWMSLFLPPHTSTARLQVKHLFWDFFFHFPNARLIHVYCLIKANSINAAWHSAFLAFGNTFSGKYKYKHPVSGRRHNYSCQFSIFPYYLDRFFPSLLTFSLC